MPIFGELRDLTLSEILPLVANRKGLLEITGQSAAERWQFGIDSGRLMAVAAHGRLLEPLEARATVHALLSRRDGSFEFSEGRELAGGGLQWGISQLLGAFHVVPSMHDGAQPADLPHPDSRFVRASSEPPLEEPLFTFWHRALPRIGDRAGSERLTALPAPSPDPNYPLFPHRRERRELAASGAPGRMRAAALHARACRMAPT